MNQGWTKTDYVGERALESHPKSLKNHTKKIFDISQKAVSPTQISISFV